MIKEKGLPIVIEIVVDIEVGMMIEGKIEISAMGTIVA